MQFLKYFLITFLIGDLILLGFFGLTAYKAHTPIDATSKNVVSIVVEPGMSAHEIANLLKQNGLIENIFYFMVYADTEDFSSKLKAGEYKFSKSMSLVKYVDMLVEGREKDSVRVTIPEGFTKESVAERLFKEGAIEDKEEFLQLTNVSSQVAADLYGVPFLNEYAAATLEGFLFPDTYEFNTPSELESVFKKFLENFENKTSDVRGQDFYGTLILASLIEEEVQTEDDMRLVSGVLKNRLDIGMALQVDATLAYITGKETKEIRGEDKLIDSLFNTYKYAGLPPAPISNPGLQAIEAALNPTPTDFFYYLSDKEGTTHFASTLVEHNENKARFLR